MTVKLGTTHPRAPGIFSQLHRTQSKRVFNESIVCKAWSVAVKAGLPYVLFLSVLKSQQICCIWSEPTFKVSSNFKNPITAEDQAFVGLRVLLHVNVYDWVLHCVTLHAKSPFFACSRRCALPLAWTESNSSQLVFKCTAQNEYLTSQISRELTWIFFFHINFSRFFRLYGYSRRSVCVSLHACVCNYKDFEWFLYYISNPTPLRGWQLQFSAPQRTVCVRANISCTTCLVTTVADTALRFMLCFPGRFSVKYTS